MVCCNGIHNIVFHLWWWASGKLLTPYPTPLEDTGWRGRADRRLTPGRVLRLDTCAGPVVVYLLPACCSGTLVVSLVDSNPVRLSRA